MEGMGEGKLYFLLLKSVKLKKALLEQSVSTSLSLMVCVIILTLKNHRHLKLPDKVSQEMMKISYIFQGNLLHCIAKQQTQKSFSKN